MTGKKVVAIWDRCRVASESRMSFVLFDNGDFMEVYPESRFIGTDADNNNLYEDTGELVIVHEYHEIKQWSFLWADHYMHCFGGRMIWRDNENR